MESALRVDPAVHGKALPRWRRCRTSWLAWWVTAGAPPPQEWDDPYVCDLNNRACAGYGFGWEDMVSFVRGAPFTAGGLVTLLRFVWETERWLRCSGLLPET